MSQALLSSLHEIQNWLEEKWGSRAKKITWELEDGTHITMPTTIFDNATTPTAPPDLPIENNSDSAMDVLSMLRDVGQRLTSMRIQSEFARRGIEWTERKIAGDLARPRDEGTLDNRSDTKPRGHELPEWDAAEDSDACQEK